MNIIVMNDYNNRHQSSALLYNKCAHHQHRKKNYLKFAFLQNKPFDVNQTKYLSFNLTTAATKNRSIWEMISTSKK